MQWRVMVEGEPCRFLVLGHLVLGERELDHRGRVEVDAARKRFTFRPDPAFLWGQRYPEAVYHLVTGTPGVVDAVGGDELLYADGRPRGGPYVALRTRLTRELVVAVVGSLTDPGAAERLATRYAGGVEESAMVAPAARYCAHVTRGLRITGSGPGVETLDTIVHCLAHEAIVHLSGPHALEQHPGLRW